MIRGSVSPDGNPGVITGMSDLPGLIQVPEALSRRSLKHIVPTGTGGTIAQLGTTANSVTTTTTSTIATTSVLNSFYRNNCGTSAGNTLFGMQTTVDAFARGANALVGGFWTQWLLAFPTFASDAIFFVGVAAANRAGNQQASGIANVCCFGADSGDANISLIGVDSGAVSDKSNNFLTKAALLTGDPVTNGPRAFAFTMYALPGASEIVCSCYDLSNNAWILTPTAKTARLPANTVALRPTAACSTTTGTASSQQFMGFTGYW